MTNMIKFIKKLCRLIFSILGVLFFISIYLGLSIKIIYLIYTIGAIGILLYHIGFKDSILREIQEFLENHHPDILVVFSVDWFYINVFYFIPFWPIIKIFEIFSTIREIILKFIIKKI